MVSLWDRIWRTETAGKGKTSPPHSDFSCYGVKTETKDRRNFTYDFQNISPFPDLFPLGGVVSSSQIQARYR